MSVLTLAAIVKKNVFKKVVIVEATEIKQDF